MVDLASVSIEVLVFEQISENSFKGANFESSEKTPPLEKSNHRFLSFCTPHDHHARKRILF